MANCRGCGGKLGRDCYHEEDCMRVVFNDGQYDAHEKLMMQPIWKTLLEIIRFRWAIFKSKHGSNNDDIPF